jgi:predicted nucleotidyltransferase
MTFLGVKGELYAALQEVWVLRKQHYDDTKKCATLLGLQVQSVVARVNFPHEGTLGLYRTLGEQS